MNWWRNKKHKVYYTTVTVTFGDSYSFKSDKELGEELRDHLGNIADKSILVFECAERLGTFRLRQTTAKIDGLITGLLVGAIFGIIVSSVIYWVKL